MYIYDPHLSVEHHVEGRDIGDGDCQADLKDSSDDKQPAKVALILLMHCSCNVTVQGEHSGTCNAADLKFEP